MEKIDHLGFVVHDLDKALKLYRDILGLEVEKIEYSEEKSTEAVKDLWDRLI